MGNIKKEIEKVYDHCTELYSKGGVTAVTDHIVKQQKENNPLYADVINMHCTACDTKQPELSGICLVCGSSIISEIGRKVTTIGEIRALISNLDNRDIAVIEACDEDGEVEDLYPMYIDVIEGIELRDNSIVNQVRFCQMPNQEPDTRDKRPIIDALINQLKQDINDGDTTVLNELLKFIPIEILINALPEQQWKNFNKKG